MWTCREYEMNIKTETQMSWIKALTLIVFSNSELVEESFHDL